MNDVMAMDGCFDMFPDIGAHSTVTVEEMLEYAKKHGFENADCFPDVGMYYAAPFSEVEEDIKIACGREGNLRANVEIVRMPTDEYAGKAIMHFVIDKRERGIESLTGYKMHAVSVRNDAEKPCKKKFRLTDIFAPVLKLFHRL